MKQALLLLLALAGSLQPATAQGPNNAEAALYAREVGGEVRIAIEVKVDKGWHLYHGPTVEEMGTEGAAGLPTRVEFDADNFDVGEIRFASKPHPVKQDIGTEVMPTIYEHGGTVTIYAKATKSSPDASLETLGATISGQTCMDGPGGMCTQYEEELRHEGAGKDELFASFSAVMDPARDPTDPEPITASSTPANGGAASTPEDAAAGAARPIEAPKDDGLLAFLLQAVFWGFITLLMPCTYPMIPITISYFTKQAAARQTSVLPLSLAYGVGIVLIFVLIGLLASTVIVPFAAHPITNLFIGVVFVVFGLSLFGLFTLEPPQFLLGLAGKASMQGGYAGVFLMGATLVVTSFTCTAPFVGALLGSTASAGFARVSLGMAVFGATMAVPFALLSLLPQKAKSLPKSGEWMHTLKVTMGFVELAAALKFLSNADLVWGWGFLSREMFLLLWMAIFAVTALYLFGLIKLSDENHAGIGPGRMVAGLCFALISAYSLYGALGNKLDPLMTAIAPPYSNAEQMGAAGTKKRTHVIVEDDLEAAIEHARSEKKRVLINFTGVT